MLLVGGCLPKQALSRHDELEADVYALSLTVDVDTRGDLAQAPFRWHLDGEVSTSYARTYRDGSLGLLVAFDGLHARIERTGAAPVDVPAGLEGAFVELRAFPDGEILKINGLTPWVGTSGHIEALDALWLALSPHVPDAKALDAPFGTSWTVWIPGGPSVTSRLVPRWQPPGGKGTDWKWSGSYSGEGGYVKQAGTAEGAVRLGGRDEPRVVDHTFTFTRTVETVWPSGARVAQDWKTTGTLRATGREPAPRLDMPVGAPDAGSDALPLRLADGREAKDAPVDVAERLPYLLLADDLPEDERARLRTAVVAAGKVESHALPP